MDVVMRPFLLLIYLEILLEEGLETCTEDHEVCF